MGAKPFSLFVFFICPLLYHDFKVFDISWSPSTEVLVCPSIVESVLETLDDVCF
uniref:HSF-type DNA-binding domain-containing protein n=1 Tax=Setaria viridis TaxID=4556 RepID=A0A4U6UR40_SETVI|nr:hypothetical protein SEVIR_5G472066v2 [Setaria viridis]